MHSNRISRSVLAGLRFVAITLVFGAGCKAPTPQANGSPTSRPPAAADSLLIRADGVGPIRLGMTLADARRACPGATFERTSDGDGAALVGVTLGRGEQLTLWADEDDPDAPIDWMRSVAVIEVFDPAFHTAEGVHAGSPVTVVEGVYGPTVRIEKSEIESREFIQFERQPTTLTFRLDDSGEFDEGSRVTTRFRPGAKIFSIALTSLGGGIGAQPLPSALPLAAAGPDSFLVEFATTKGRFVVKARRAWSPLGADRLYHLARARYYDGVVIYRVGPTASYEGGFVVQFGIGNDSTVNAAWGETGIDDEPVRAPHGRGRIYFARGGPRTRSVELALDLTANSPLDTVRYEGVIGFPPIGEVVAGMAVLDALNRQHGNAVFEHWDSVSTRGRAYLDRAYPGLDRIDSARVVRTWPAPTTEESP